MSDIMKKILFILLVAGSVVCLSVQNGFAAHTLNEGLENLSTQIAAEMSHQQTHTVAVVEFSDLDGRITELGRFLSEELITRLFMTRTFTVIERQLLNKIIQEHKLNMVGLIDQSTAKKLGKILGVDAICTGTITDLVTTVKVNARLISTETGSVFAVAASEIKKDKVIEKLMGKISYVMRSKGPASGGKSVLPGKVVFMEDFSGYEEGDPTDWGRNVYVKTLKDGRKYLVSSIPGRHTVGQNVMFPKDFYFQFDYQDWAERSTISLVDTKGMKYSIKWSSNGNHFTLPGGARNRSRINKGKTVRLNVKNNVIKIYVDGKFAVSGVVKGYDRFARFEVDVSQTSGGWHIYLTNFRIGEL